MNIRTVSRAVGFLIPLLITGVGFATAAAIRFSNVQHGYVDASGLRYSADSPTFHTYANGGVVFAVFALICLAGSLIAAVVIFGELDPGVREKRRRLKKALWEGDGENPQDAGFAQFRKQARLEDAARDHQAMMEDWLEMNARHTDEAMERMKRWPRSN